MRMRRRVAKATVATISWLMKVSLVMSPASWGSLLRTLSAGCSGNFLRSTYGLLPPRLLEWSWRGLALLEQGVKDA